MRRVSVTTIHHISSTSIWMSWRMTERESQLTHSLYLSHEFYHLTWRKQYYQYFEWFGLRNSIQFCGPKFMLSAQVFILTRRCAFELPKKLHQASLNQFENKFGSREELKAISHNTRIKKLWPRLWWAREKSHISALEATVKIVRNFSWPWSTVRFTVEKQRNFAFSYWIDRKSRPIFYSCSQSWV